jgi:KaiC.
MHSPYEFKEQDAFDFARHVQAETNVRNGELFFKICPYCNPKPTRDNIKSFSINLTTGRFKCFRASCGVQGNMITLAKDFDFFLGNEVDEYYQPKKQYRKFKKKEKPIEPKPEAIQYLESRGISEEVAKEYEITVQTDKPNILVFPFYDEKGILQFVKYRKTDYDKEKDKNKEWCEANCKPILFGMKQCKDFSRLVITEGQCFNGDAEIMTPNGWVRLEDYAGQQVLQVNEDMSADFIVPKSYIVKRHIGKMVDVEIGGNYFTSTTDDHNIVFTNRKGKVLKKKAIEKISTAYHIPTTINFNGRGANWNNDEIALLIAISADGTIDKRKNSYYNRAKSDYYVRFGLTKDRKTERLLGILKRLGYKYSNNELEDKGKIYHSICFPIPDKFSSKYLPWWFVTDTTLKQKRFIIEEMVWWDGNHVKGRNQYEYMSIYKHNADIIQAVSSTCGYMSTIMKKQSGGNGDFKKGYVFKVSILLGKHDVSTQQFEKHKNVYEVDKQVYCVSVDSGMILVRQNDKISVSGNCDSLSVATAGISNAVSVPTGAKGFTWVPYCWNWINQFEEIVVFGDFEKGHITLLDELSRRLKITVKHVREEDYKDCKDANEILKKYGKEQVRACVENAVIVPMKQVKPLSSVKNVDIFKLPKLQTGIRQVDRLLYGGLPFGGVTLISGKTGEGKSVLASQIMISAVSQGYKCFAYSGELVDFQFKNIMDFQIAGSRHIFEYQNGWGDSAYNISETNRNLISDWYDDKFWLYDNSIVENDEQESLVSVTENVIMQYGVKVILLDNLMTAIDLEVAYGSDKYERQGLFVKKLARLATRHNALILLVAHKRKNNFSTNENDEISGSSDIPNLAMVTIAYEKNNEIELSQRLCKVSKNRLFGKTETKGYILDYDEKSKRIYGQGDDLYVDYGWNKNDGGFISINEETPFE